MVNRSVKTIIIFLSCSQQNGTLQKDAETKNLTTGLSSPPSSLHHRRRRRWILSQPPETRTLKRSRTNIPNPRDQPQPFPLHRIISAAQRNLPLSSPHQPNPPPSPSQLQNRPLLLPIPTLLTLSFDDNITHLLQPHHRHPRKSPPIRRRSTANRRDGAAREPQTFLGDVPHPRQAPNHRRTHSPSRPSFRRRALLPREPPRRRRVRLSPRHAL